MARSGNTGYETQKLYQKARQAAYRRLEALHHEEFLQLLHDVQHEPRVASHPQGRRPRTSERESMTTFGSMFAGIGGMDLGLERAGWTCRWQVENNPYCRQVLQAHWPDVLLYEDTREVDWNVVERVDLVAAGFPCQPVSYAGNRAAQDDSRWLWPEVARAVRVLRPRFVLVENVPGLFTAGFDDVLSDLAALGFDAEWSVLSACGVGAPHPRERVFVVAYPPDGYGEGDVPRHSHPGVPRESRGSRRPTGGDGWLPEPAMDRVAHGVPSRLVRAPLYALGNAIVPQVAERIGRQLIDCHCGCHAVIQPGLVPCSECDPEPEHSSR